MALKSNTIKITIKSTLESSWYLSLDHFQFCTMALKSDLIKSTWTEKPKIWWAWQISDTFLGFLCWWHCRNNLQHFDQTGSWWAIEHVDVLKVELLQMLSMLTMLTILISTMNMLTTLTTFLDHFDRSHQWVIMSTMLTMSPMLTMSTIVLTMLSLLYTTCPIIIFFIGPRSDLVYLCQWLTKGSFHLRFSGIRPLRGGVPPFSAKEKNLLFFTLIFR